MLRADSSDTTGATTLRTDTVAVAARVLTRRGTIAALTKTLGGTALVAAAAGLPLVATAAEPDPIFAVIQQHRDAYRAHAATCDAPEEEQIAACRAEWAVADKLLTAQPTTIAGVAALARYAVEVEAKGEYWGLPYDYDPEDRSWWWFFVRNLSAALDRLAVGA
jgi:hypothetical protein